MGEQGGHCGVQRLCTSNRLTSQYATSKHRQRECFGGWTANHLKWKLKTIKKEECHKNLLYWQMRKYILNMKRSFISTILILLCSQIPRQFYILSNILMYHINHNQSNLPIQIVYLLFFDNLRFPAFLIIVVSFTKIMLTHF